MKVGFNKGDYPEQRCIINKVKGCEYVYLPKSKILKIRDLLERKLYKKKMSTYQFIHTRISHKSIDGYHFFNDVLTVNKPYITTFETFLPRINDLSDIHQSKENELKIDNKSRVAKKLGLLAKDNCKKIIALSECNYKMQLDLLKLFPSLEGKIINKIIQVNPPQKMLIKKYEDKKLDLEKIRFVFIGRDFVRKGGVEIVKAFHNIMKIYNFKIELILITDLNETYNYAFKNFQDNEVELEAIKEIINNNNWIKLYKNIPNDEVIDIIKDSHVGLLTTWADTYGYSVLEFQAAGCPVITTNVRALSEINNNECGWIIDVNTNCFGEVVIQSIEEKNKLRSCIVKELENTIKNICENKMDIEKKGKKSMNRIKKYHCPDKYEDTLKKLYIESFER